MTEAIQDLPKWDLSDLYVGVDDPRLEADLDALVSRASDFEQRYKGTIAASGVTTEQLRAALDAYESLARKAFRPMAFARLLFSTNTKHPQHGALLQRVQEAASKINSHLVFLDLEVGQIPQAAYDELVQSEGLATYRHHLDKTRAHTEHNLSETEEKILVATDSVRGAAFSRLFTEIHGRSSFSIERDGEVQTLTQSEILALLHDPDRSVRGAAAASVSEGVKANAHVGTFIYNTKIHEKAILDRLRGFELAESARHLSNEIRQDTVDAMVEVCVNNFDMVADYYRLKGRLLGLEELTHYDRYAPLGEIDTDIAFEDAKEIVVDAFSHFSPKLSDMVEPFFSERWIDAALVDGKSGGAYCAGIAPDLHPYVFMNYTHTVRDVMTLAHELGHGVHDVLASRNHMLDYHPPLPLAETASTFGEMLVFDKLLSGLDDEADKLALICNKIEDTFSTVFRQVEIFRFERLAHQARRDRGELTTEAFCELWQTTQQEMFGDALTLGEDHAWWWLYIPHIVQTPFYVYAYAFGELLVLSLYAQYEREGDGFVEKYFELLAAGGSQSPAELVGRMGFDIADPDFWQAGCDLLRQRVERAKALAA